MFISTNIHRSLAEISGREEPAVEVECIYLDAIKSG